MFSTTGKIPSKTSYWCFVVSSWLTASLGLDPEDGISLKRNDVLNDVFVGILDNIDYPVHWCFLLFLNKVDKLTERSSFFDFETSFTLPIEIASTTLGFIWVSSLNEEVREYFYGMLDLRSLFFWCACSLCSKTLPFLFSWWSLLSSQTELCCAFSWASLYTEISSTFDKPEPG